MEVSVGPPTVTIHFDDDEAVCEPSAEMSSTKEQGYFASDTRLISGYRLKLCGKQPVLCDSAAVRHHSARFEFTNPALIAADGEPLEEHVLHLSLDRTIGHGDHEDYDLTSFARRPVVVELRGEHRVGLRRPVRCERPSPHPPRIALEHLGQTGRLFSGVEAWRECPASSRDRSVGQVEVLCAHGADIVATELAELLDRP